MGAFNPMDMFNAGGQLGQASASPFTYGSQNVMDNFRMGQQLQMQLAGQLGLKNAENQLPLNPTDQKLKDSEITKNNATADYYKGPDAGSTGIDANGNPLISGGAKYRQQQDKLENDAIQRITSVRGDSSLKQMESQRDASSMAYNTLSRIKSENRDPSKGEYFDTLAQLYKARTGVAPTDQMIQDLDTKTFQGDFKKMASYWTGKPMGNTTQDVLNNLIGFVQDSGTQADKMHDAYMQPHLIKPAGLEDARWQRIASTARGLSFAQATGQNNQNPILQAASKQKTGGTGKFKLMRDKSGNTAKVYDDGTIEEVSQ